MPDFFFFSDRYRTHPDPPLFPEHIRGRSDGPALGAAPRQGELPRRLRLPGLRSGHHGHTARQAHVHKGNRER
jgi:hypothetical protein